MHNPALVNQAPPWPPAPELIANPPNWGLPTCSNVAAQRCMGDPGAETHVSAPLADCSERSSRYSSTGGRAGYQQEPKGTAQYFIGRDGNAWPMPPSECMPGGGGPSSLHPSRSSRLEPRCRIVWSADDCEDDQAGDALIPRTREDDSSGVMHSSLSPSAMSDSSSPQSHRSPIDVAPTPPDVPHETQSLAELGRQWYATWGKEVGAASEEFLSRSTQSTPDIELEDTEGVYWDTGGYFLGSDGSLWPLPPPPPTHHPPKLARGRRRLPKW
ncbi:hypothetical protein BD414DRAFT_486996 [Trametes punicea]|nr:hypothetical protein BD414DRAFT_486996 [Trametes punicea]